jgi:LmbE family N-acetylglucosaminyl deacetylase
MKTHQHPLTFVAVFLLFVSVTPRIAPADMLPEDRGAAGLWQELRQLRTTASALHITAHPDDEDGGMLTMLSRGKGAHVTLLTLNRGEGGADLIAPFFFDSLGVLRTLELLQADRYYGVNQYFSRVVDYGFSKTMDEALQKWGGQDNVLRDVVRVVRRERPEVIIARFRGDPRDGHGNHQTAGLMAKLVFEAAGDPNRFPEQIQEGLRPWQPKKLYQNNIRPDARAEDKDSWTLVVNSGEYDPVLGRSYIQISREGLNFQRSQGGGGRAQPAGEVKSYYRLLKAAKLGYAPQREESFFDGMDTSIAGIAAVGSNNPPAELVSGLNAISGAVETAVSSFDARNPEKTVAPLAEGLGATRQLLSKLKDLPLNEEARNQIAFLLQRKTSQFQSALVSALSLDLDAAVQPDKPATGPFAEFATPVTFNHATPGQTFGVRVRLVNRSHMDVKPAAIRIAAPQGWDVSSGDAQQLKTIGYNQAQAFGFTVKVPDDAQPTRPYWRRNNIEEAVYEIIDPGHQDLPLTPPPALAEVKLKVLGAEIEMKSPVHVIQRNAPYGFVTPPLTVVPHLGVSFPVEQGIIPLGRNQYRVSAAVHSSVKGPAKGTLKLELPEGWKSTPAAAEFSFEKEDEEAPFDFIITVPAQLQHSSPYTIKAVASYDGREYRDGYRTVSAHELQRFNLYRMARHEVAAVDVKVASNLRVGYVMGSGDEVPQSLEAIGVQPEMLGPADLAKADLKKYDVILLGVRAYAVRPDVKTYNARLLNYVHDGGVLIVQYQTPEFDNNYGPYPYVMGSNPEEVSEEDSELKILAPTNPIFTVPNRITMADFTGWVEERGSKFLKSWDSKYVPLVESHDKGQAPQEGGMVYAPYGKGVYIYTAYAWYRQLPSAVPGAFRIYANMISLPRTLPERQTTMASRPAVKTAKASAKKN